MTIPYFLSKNRAFFSCAFFLFAISPGCKKNPDQNGANGIDTQKNVQTVSATTTYATEYPVYKSQTEKELSANRDTIESFKARLRKVNAKMRESLDSAERALEMENANLQSRLESFKAEGQDKWDQFKTEFDRSMDTVRENLRDLNNRYTHIKVED